MEHDPEKWVPVFGKDHARTDLGGASDERRRGERRDDRLRRASVGAGHAGAAALSRRPLAHHGGRARHRFARQHQLSAQCAALGAPRPARCQGARRHGRGEPRRPGARPLGRRRGDPQLSLRHPARLRRIHGGGVRGGAQRVDRARMARPRSAPARLDRGGAAERRARGRRDRAARRRQALRADPGARHGRDAARTAAVLADLRGGRAARPADRHPCGQRLSSSRHGARLAELLRRGLRQPVAGLPVADREPDQRGRVRQVSRAEGGADRVRA